jgi:hypothetical protein
MLPCQKRRNPTCLGAQGLSLLASRRDPGHRGQCEGADPVFNINNLIKHAPAHDSRQSSANSAMLTCCDFRNRKVREALGGGQATEDQNRNLNKRVKFYRNRNLEERVKFRCQVARPPLHRFNSDDLKSFHTTNPSQMLPIRLSNVAKTTKIIVGNSEWIATKIFRRRRNHCERIKLPLRRAGTETNKNEKGAPRNSTQLN